MFLRKIIYNPNYQITLFGLITFFFIIQGVDAQKYLLVTLPFLAIAAFITFFKPSLILFLFLGTFYIGSPLIEHAMISVVVADVALLFLCAAFFSRLFTKNDLSFHWSDTKWGITFLLAVFFIVSAFSVLLNMQTKDGIDILVSLWYMLNLIQLIVVFLIFSHKGINASREQCINLVLLFSIFELVVAFLQYAQTGGMSVDNMRDVTGTFLTHHSMLGNMMIFPLAFCIYRMASAGHPFSKIGYLLGSALSFYTIVISGSRSSLVGVVFSIVIWLLAAFRISWKYITLIIFVGMIGVGFILFSPLAALVIDTFQNSQTSMLDMSSYQRLLIWRGTLDKFVEAPIISKLFGIGIGNFYTMKYSFQMGEGFNWASGAHNNYIHVLIETGIIGFVVFMFFLGLILVALKRRSKTDRLCLVLFYATLAFCFSGLTQETFWFQPAFSRFWLTYMLFLGLCLGDTDLSRAENSAPAPA